MKVESRVKLINILKDPNKLTMFDILSSIKYESHGDILSLLIKGRNIGVFVNHENIWYTSKKASKDKIDSLLQVDLNEDAIQRSVEKYKRKSKEKKRRKEGRFGSLSSKESRSARDSYDEAYPTGVVSTQFSYGRKKSSEWNAQAVYQLELTIKRKAEERKREKMEGG